MHTQSTQHHYYFTIDLFRLPVCQAIYSHFICLPYESESNVDKSHISFQKKKSQNTFFVYFSIYVELNWLATHYISVTSFFLLYLVSVRAFATKCACMRTNIDVMAIRSENTRDSPRSRTRNGCKFQWQFFHADSRILSYLQLYYILILYLNTYTLNSNFGIHA